ncbi:hypothetical protein [Luteimonas sp. MC1828]|uniref:hypothetical protein n=1 Tax=Luteimonas sp. MC1828 TaxID=2799787 RepID=UPI0018F1A018|nr:hypothetical protein [Luteimonas sp. MC1828]MBJ7574110.1 hypothetical protein [Luteimonas sp. MC1828]
MSLRNPRSPVLFALCLGFASLAPAAHAQNVAPGDIDRLAGLLVEMMPIGDVFDAIAKQDPTWPLQERPDAVTAEQLACMRGELSSAGYRRAKRADASAYASAHPSRVRGDIALLEGGASVLFGRLVMEGAATEGGGDSNAVLAGSTPAQLLSFMTVMTDPKHAALREAAGMGDAIDATRSAEENEKSGYQLGASIVTQLMIKSLDTCQVPTSAILG